MKKQSIWPNEQTIFTFQVVFDPIPDFMVALNESTPNNTYCFRKVKKLIMTSLGLVQKIPPVDSHIKNCTMTVFANPGRKLTPDRLMTAPQLRIQSRFQWPLNFFLRDETHATINSK